MSHARAGVALLLAALLAGCAAAGRTRSNVSQSAMPCTEAARVAQGALLRIGYVPQSTVVPQPGAPGTVIGTKPSGVDYATYQPTGYYTTTVTITCSNAGADFAAETDEPIPGSLSFKSDFAAAVETVATRRVNRPAIKERPATGMVITIEPLRRSEGGTVTGTTTVRVKLENKTDRTYAFAGERVEMVTQEGGRTAPLDDAALAKLSSSAAADRIADGTLAPGASLSGMLYFPASAYQRATVVLIDTDTEEEEGFRVEF
ncbi:MAG: hypothetical protein SF182_27570 [Deltaproteobacteria bacterium]|nr:hypothetical protein [Deltaproteobacteria bacterium]